MIFSFQLRIFLVAVALFAWAIPCAEAAVAISVFAQPAAPSSQNSQVDYSIDMRNQRFLIYVPDDYTGKKPFGLIVYISPNESINEVPAGWAEVLDSRHIIFVAPQQAGNGSSYQNKREGKGIMGAMAAMRQYRIDPARVYAAGFSGGARTASDMAMHQPDLFRGTIQSCGTDFYHSVPSYYAKSHTDTNGNNYGVIEGVTDNGVNQARSRVRFVLITGSGDFRRGNVTDIYYYGYNKEKFQAKLIDVPGMGHQDCDGDALEGALKFIEGSAASSAPPHPRTEHKS